MARPRSYVAQLNGVRQNLATACGITPGSAADVGFSTMIFEGVHELTGPCWIGAAGMALVLHLDKPPTPNDHEFELMIPNTGGARLSDWDVQGVSGNSLGVLGIAD